MSNFALAFNPQLPLSLIIGLCLLAGLLAILGLWRGLNGSWFRALALGVLALALFEPSFVREEREPLKSIVILLVDETASQKIDVRPAQREAVRKAINDKIGRYSEFEIREVTVTDQLSSTTDVSTALFSALKTAVQDTPLDRVGGAIFLTDGQVHDIPETLDEIGINAPLHALITGREDESDRHLVITHAPRFGVVGEEVSMKFLVHQQGMDDQKTVRISVVVDGEIFSTRDVVPNRENEFVLEVPHGGETIVELRADVAPDELTDVNNRAFFSLNGIRENLRVLLISGEPHAGERTWRNLLKSDASVDLVHFTILRPPQKQDGTPINQLSLIAFPTRELFIEKIDEFDLIIFDRYSRRGVLPTLYFDNIARYVENGGAVLIAAGPELAQEGSIAQTALQRILPAKPNGEVEEMPFIPAVTELGKRHPVTRDLPGSNSEPAKWSRWFRLINSFPGNKNALLKGPADMPLLMLHREQEGRVAMFMSDHVWLWARGFEGGGPHVQLLRRLAHWLMKEPELSEENLTAFSKGNRLTIRRQTLKEESDPISIKPPTGEAVDLPMTQVEPGVYEAQYEATQIGLHQVESGELRALAQIGPANPREFSDVLSSTQLLKDIVEQSQGSIVRVSENSSPRIVSVRGNSSRAGNGWIGLKNTQSSKLIGVSATPLFNGLFGLALLLFAMGFMWAREGR